MTRHLRFVFILILVSFNSSFAIEVSCQKEMELGYTFLSDGDYTSALYQFRRVCEICDTVDIKNRAEYLMAVTNILLNRKKDAESQLLNIMSQNQHPYKEQAAFMLSFVIEKGHESSKLEMYLRELLDYGLTSNELKDSVRYKLAWVHMKKGDFETAMNFLKQIEQSQELKTSAHEILEGVGEYKNLSYKSPGVAGILSAVLPGAGQCYVGRPRDGFAAFLVNALFLSATIQAFGHDQEFLGVLLAGLEVGWYAGNIYNAVNSAHKYNRKQREGLLARFRNNLELDLLLGDKGELGLLFGFRF